MGYYIETSGAKGKAAWLVAHAGGTIVQQASPSANSIPVVVMDNGPFEAAGVAFNSGELAAFTDPSDHRRRTIVMVPRAKVLEYCPQVESRLNW